MTHSLFCAVYLVVIVWLSCDFRLKSGLKWLYGRVVRVRVQGGLNGLKIVLCYKDCCGLLL